MSAILGLLSETGRSDLSEPCEILRFRTSERHIHWATAIPFIVCYTTALILITVYNPNPARPFRWLVSWTHRLSGLCLLVVPLSTIVRHRHDIRIHRDNVSEVWRWTRDDLRWLSLIAPASISRKIQLPHQGKFNAGEKINFVVLTSTYPLYILSGLAIWFGAAAYLPWLVHFSLATMATPLICGHIMMATVNPDTRPGLTGMITGFVDREWANHHYHLWYQKHYGKRARAAASAAVVEAPRQPAAAALRHADGVVSPPAHHEVRTPPPREPALAPIPVSLGAPMPQCAQPAGGLASRNWLACLDCIRRIEHGIGGRDDRPRCLPCVIEVGARVTE